MNVSICCPSYKRPKVETLDIYPSTRVYVDEGEYKDYVDANPDEANIISVPKGIQGNLCRIRNYILDTEFTRGVEAVCIIDDDMQGVCRYVPKEASRGIFGYERRVLTEPELYDFIEKGSILCNEWGYKFWGVNCLMDPMAYRQYNPFNTTKYIGGPFQVHLENPIRYDERLPLKEDYDMTLQHLAKYRGALRFNMFHYLCKQSEQTGGCAAYRNIKKEMQQFNALQSKWGSKIIKQDKGSKKAFDYNPILKSPIKGA